MSQEILNWIVGGLLAILGWIGRVLWESLKEYREELKSLTARISSIEVLVAGNYVEKSYFESKIEALFTKFDNLKDNIGDKLDDLKDRIDGKADKEK